MKLYYVPEDLPRPEGRRRRNREGKKNMLVVTGAAVWGLLVWVLMHVTYFTLYYEGQIRYSRLRGKVASL